MNAIKGTGTATVETSWNNLHSHDFGKDNICRSCGGTYDFVADKKCPAPMLAELDRRAHRVAVAVWEWLQRRKKQLSESQFPWIGDEPSNIDRNEEAILQSLENVIIEASKQKGIK